MSKTLFYGYGYRDTKSWSCSACNNYHVGGMDLFVDESIKEHLNSCTAAKETFIVKDHVVLGYGWICTMEVIDGKRIAKPLEYVKL